jgi:hypothetical protein
MWTGPILSAVPIHVTIEERTTLEMRMQLTSQEGGAASQEGGVACS